MALDALIVGCGDVGCRVAQRLSARGLVTIGIVRSEARVRLLSELGVRGIALDLDAIPLPAGALPQQLDTIYYFAPPPGSGAEEKRLRALLDALPAPPRRLLYLSTSAVYADADGAWIDESADLAPAHDRGRRRLDGERVAQRYAADHGCQVVIARVPGIYGPGRLPLERLRSGQPVLSEAESPFTNRIHADDLADALIAIAERGVANAAYNVGDGAPTTMTDYFLRCAELLGLPAPPQVTMDQARRQFSAALLSFLESSKRLDVGALQRLGWAPRYPTLAAGLPHCLDDDAISATLRREGAISAPSLRPSGVHK